MKIISKREKKYFGQFKAPLIDSPDLVVHQTESFRWLLDKGLAEAFKEFSPIKDYAEKKFELSFSSFQIYFKLTTQYLPAFPIPISRYSLPINPSR